MKHLYSGSHLELWNKIDIISTKHIHLRRVPSKSLNASGQCWLLSFSVRFSVCPLDANFDSKNKKITKQWCSGKWPVKTLDKTRFPDHILENYDRRIWPGDYSASGALNISILCILEQKWPITQNYGIIKLSFTKKILSSKTPNIVCLRSKRGRMCNCWYFLLYIGLHFHWKYFDFPF